jgi:hypothetical protein
MSHKAKSPKKVIISKDEKQTGMDTIFSKQWLNNLYDTSLLDDQELKDFYNQIRYKGFNRNQVLSQLEQQFPEMKLLSEVIIVCTLRGPQKAQYITLSNGKSLFEMGIPGSGTQGSEKLSCNKIASATADLAAFYLKKLDVPKRIDMPLPGWLQFPTAGSIKLPEELRKQHVSFHKQFSKIIGGQFNEQIYQNMMSNAYLDPKLHLFDD